MNDWNEENDRASVEKITSHLREPVHLDEAFDLRVMSAVHAEALAKVDAMHTATRSALESEGPWWQRRYTVRFSAFSGLALAASIFGIVLAGATLFSRQPVTTASPARTAVTQPARRQNVSFILVDGSATQVWLVGDFNGWAKSTTPLRRAANGQAWTVSVPLSHGRHEYAFIVSDDNGERWVADPLTRIIEDEFGTESSVVRVEPAEGA
jgi:hypothetical protein